MLTEDQRDVIAFLEAPATHDGAPVERIDTHTSIVFLAGARALKLKRAVRYDYLDYSTLGRRRDMCEAELRINQRTAPDLYRRVMPVTRTSDDRFALGGDGTPVEWLVEMARFDQDQLLDRLATRRALGIEVMTELGDAIAAFHASADVHFERGGSAGIAGVIDGNQRGFADQGAAILDASACAALIQAQRGTAATHQDLLESRRMAGHVRRCHGDLHLRNIVMRNGRPTLFDAVEFNDDFSVVDVLYDLAFLVMDVWRRGLPGHACAVWNRYLSASLDLGGIPLVPLFLSCRAAVRAKTSATAAMLEADVARRRTLEDTAQDYLSLASRLLHPSRGCIVAIGGLSGSGKSTLAKALAPRLGSPPGALIIRSDEVRKQMFGIASSVHLGTEGYTPEATGRTYRHVSERAVSVARSNWIALVDAAFLEAGHRLGIERAAAHAGVPFAGLWLEAPERLLVDRVVTRHADVSDADASVVRQQSHLDVGPVGWHRLDASGSPESVVDRALEVLRNVNPDTMVPPTM